MAWSDLDAKSAPLSGPRHLPPEIPSHRLIRLLVSGSYGEVWLARSVVGAWRAVKIIYRDRFEDSRPFEREFQGMCQFEPISRTHEGFVDILQIGQTHDGTCFYYVMELADDANTAAPLSNDELLCESIGANAVSNYTPRTLRSDIKRRGRLPLDQCLSLGLALTDALAHLDRHKLVHRDVKPSNIIFVNRAPKLADIGLVTRADQAQSLVGTEGFIPPEGPGTPHADLYSLGKLLYEAATGKDRLKFPEPLSDVDANLELVEFNQVVLKACASDPRSRYTASARMREDLLVVQSGKSLRRLHQLEWRMARVARVGIVALLLLLIATVGWLVQRRHAQQLTQLANESRHRLMRLHVVNGVQAMEEGDFFMALPWFVESLKLAQTPEEAWPHRSRIEAILRQCPRLLTLGRHDGAVNSAEFSNDGRRIITASDDGTARVWNATTGQPLTPPLAHKGPVNEGRFSPQGDKVISAAEDGTARVWDATTGKELLPPLTHATNVLRASFSSTGKWILTASEDKTARMWEASTGRPAGTILSHEDTVSDAAFSPDERLVVTASHDGTAQLWRVPEGTRVSPPLRHTDKVRSISFSPDGRRVATISDDGTARVWDTTTGQPATPPMRHPFQGWHVVFSRNGEHLLTCSGAENNRSGEARVWNAVTGQPISPPLRHPARIKHGSFSSAGTLVATASHDGTVRLWETDSGKPIGPPLKHHQLVWSAVFGPEGLQLLTAGREGLWRLWDLNVVEWFNPPGPFHVRHGRETLRFNGGDVVGAWKNMVRTWPTSAGKAERPSLDHPATVLSIRLGGSGNRVLTGCADGQVRLWDALSGQLILRLIGHTGYVHSVALSPDGRFIASASADRTARIWDSNNVAAWTQLLLHDKPVWFVEFSPVTDRVITCSSEMNAQGFPVGPAEVRVWNTTTGQLAIPPLGHGASLTQPVLSPDGRRIIAGCKDGAPSASDAHIWDTRTGKAICPPLKHSGAVSCVAFNNDGRRVVTSSGNGTVRVWDAISGQPLTGWMKHPGGVEVVSFSPDGRCLLTAGNDGTARIWDATTFDPLGPPFKHAERLAFASFNPTGQRILTLEWRTANVRLWNCPSDHIPNDRLELIVAALSGAYIDSTTGLTSLTPRELEAAWGRIGPSIDSTKKGKRVESFGIQQLRRQAHMEVRGSDEPFFYPLETQQPQH